MVDGSFVKYLGVIVKLVSAETCRASISKMPDLGLILIFEHFWLSPKCKQQYVGRY